MRGIEDRLLGLLIEPAATVLGDLLTDFAQNDTFLCPSRAAICRLIRDRPDNFVDFSLAQDEPVPRA